MSVSVLAPTEVDPVKYEIFAHRLWAVGEEGRIGLQRVSASPIVSQGGECMCSFYDTDGNMILACSGHLRFAAATSDAIRKMVEWFSDNPGINQGDHFFFNDPYVAGSHTYDHMQITPVFWQGRRIAWVASSSHTADTGGLLRGGATEIYHEGLRIMGVKVVENGRIREDVFKSLVEQCRDPDYVAMDLKSRIAANNICERGYLALVEKFGVEFVEAAGRKMIEDSERMAREKLRSIPDGTWASRIFATALNTKTREADPFQVVCTMTKTGDELFIDLTGTSGQMLNDQNSTYPSTVAHVTIALTNQLFWDVPWSDGKLAPVHITVPEGSILHCKFPAACGGAPRVGQYLVSAVSDCLAKMLFAGGRLQDVNASWQGLWYMGGPGYFYGGHNAQGLPNPQGLYDIHGGGLGAMPLRDGVSSGGHMNIPSGGISDVELIELQYPFMYFTRRHNPDGAGFGRYTGGFGTARLLRAYGSDDLSADFKPYGGIPSGAFGLFGGYPCGISGVRAIFEPVTDIDARLAASDYPTHVSQLSADGWGKMNVPAGSPPRLPIPAGFIISDFVQGGGGYGDPLDREPEVVARDVANGLVTLRAADLIFGVKLQAGVKGKADVAATERRREEIRAERKEQSRQPEAGLGDCGNWTSELRFHEYLEIAQSGGEKAVRCRRCHYLLCHPDQNYKRFALRRDRDLEQFSGQSMPDGRLYLGVFREYACPGCATQLQVDIYCPALDGVEDWWDVRINQGASA